MFYASIYFVLISSTAGMKDLVRVEVSATGRSTLLEDDVTGKGRLANVAADGSLIDLSFTDASLLVERFDIEPLSDFSAK